MFSEECFFALKIFSFGPSVRERAGEHYAGRQYRGTLQKTPEGTKVPSATSVASIPDDTDDTAANRSTHRPRAITGPLGVRAPGSLPSSGLCSVVSLPYERIYKHGAAAGARTSGTHRWFYGLERRGRGGEPRGEH